MRAIFLSSQIEKEVLLIDFMRSGKSTQAELILREPWVPSAWDSYLFLDLARRGASSRNIVCYAQGLKGPWKLYGRWTAWLYMVWFRRKWGGQLSMLLHSPMPEKAQLRKPEMKYWNNHFSAQRLMSAFSRGARRTHWSSTGAWSRERSLKSLEQPPTSWEVWKVMKWHHHCKNDSENSPDFRFCFCAAFWNLIPYFLYWVKIHFTLEIWWNFDIPYFSSL